MNSELPIGVGNSRVFGVFFRLMTEVVVVPKKTVNLRFELFRRNL